MRLYNGYVVVSFLPQVTCVLMSLRAGCRLISLAEKELITSSNCSGKQRQGVILIMMQLGKKADHATETLQRHLKNQCKTSSKYSCTEITFLLLYSSIFFGHYVLTNNMLMFERRKSC